MMVRLFLWSERGCVQSSSLLLCRGFYPAAALVKYYSQAWKNVHGQDSEAHRRVYRKVGKSSTAGEAGQTSRQRQTAESVVQFTTRVLPKVLGKIIASCAVVPFNRVRMILDLQLVVLLGV